jgi:hypothetical protein
VNPEVSHWLVDTVIVVVTDPDISVNISPDDPVAAVFVVLVPVEAGFGLLLVSSASVNSLSPSSLQQTQ